MLLTVLVVALSASSPAEADATDAPVAPSSKLHLLAGDASASNPSTESMIAELLARRPTDGFITAGVVMTFTGVAMLVSSAVLIPLTFRSGIGLGEALNFFWPGLGLGLGALVVGTVGIILWVVGRRGQSRVDAEIARLRASPPSLTPSSARGAASTPFAFTF